MMVLLSATLMLVDLSVAVMKVTVFVAIIQLEVSATLVQVKIFAANMGDNFYPNYEHGSLCCNHAGDILYSALCT